MLNALGRWAETYPELVAGFAAAGVGLAIAIGLAAVWALLGWLVGP
jgi:hypothetical protein